jgi:hypothetical protein
MSEKIIVANFLELTTASGITASGTPISGTTHRYQNFFYGTNDSQVAVPGTSVPLYEFAPFRAEGSLASLNGENALLRVLFPHSEFSVALVEEGDGNRLSRLSFKTAWLGNTGSLSSYENYSTVASYDEYYIGVGASFDDTTVELRFRSAMDSVGANFPRRTFNTTNVGILPVTAEVSFR